jgi:hypothetical protein
MRAFFPDAPDVSTGGLAGASPIKSSFHPWSFVHNATPDDPFRRLRLF